MSTLKAVPEAPVVKILRPDKSDTIKSVYQIQLPRHIYDISPSEQRRPKLAFK